MNLQKWFYLFWTTACIGAGISLISGLSLQIFQGEMSNFKGLSDFSLNVLQFIFGGFLISVYSQMGFFAYLTLNYIASGLFKKRWPYIQVLFTMTALFDLMFLRMLLVDKPGEIVGSSRYEDILLGIVVFGIAWGVSCIKVKLTHSTALVPTLFFMIVITTVEMLISLPIGNRATWFIYIPLATCNAYQILILPRVLGLAAHCYPE